VGVLTIAIHPALVAAQLGRVLARVPPDAPEYCLVAFFHPQHLPKYVPCGSLFQLENHGVGFLLGEGSGTFVDYVKSNEVSVDWLLEQLFIGAQSLAIGLAPALFPTDLTKVSTVAPNAQVTQQVMVQCVCYTTVLLLCYLCSQYEIPAHKLEQMVCAALKAHAPAHVTTEVYLGRIQGYLRTILGVPVSRS
jgi:hypothetical protein